jgi:uncharacterized protein (DUF58 family)
MGEGQVRIERAARPSGRRPVPPGVAPPAAWPSSDKHGERRLVIRRLQFLIVAVALLIAAFATGYAFLFYVVYLGLLAIGGSYVLTRFGLADLEAGYRVDHRQGHVGDDLRTTYSISNASGLPKPWLEVYSPTDLPVPVPGRALGLRSWAQRSWIAIVPLSRRGSFRIEPMVVRTGDPFGFFEAAATVGRPTVVTVFPRVLPLPRWRLPNAYLEGTHSAPERTLQTTPLATTVRPYAPGDSFNRIHWRSTARLGEIQVKEFDLEQTADVWLFVDLEARVQTGEGDMSTVEEVLRVAASIVHDAILENRAVGMTTSGHRLVSIPADRGPRPDTTCGGATDGAAQASTGHDGRGSHRLAGAAMGADAHVPASPGCYRRGGGPRRR